VNGRKVPKTAVEAYVESIREYVEDRAADGDAPTFFEVLTGLALSGCATAPLETASRNAPSPMKPKAAAQATAPEAFHVSSVRVSVPRELRVSEANRFYPGGDIVWREDPPGDRHEQVRKIVETAMVEGVSGLDQSGTPVMLDIKVTRFHALTEKARYTVGGVHALQFEILLRDAQTGAPLGEPRFVKADFKALGGRAAVNAENAGLTQKVRITRHLANVIRQQLTDPEGYHAADLGLLGAINQL